MNPSIELPKARKAAGMSQRELAARSGLPQSTIARIESGLVSPRIGTFERLLSLCGCRLSVVKMGEGIDRTMMRELIKLSPDELMELAAKEANNLAELLASTERM